MDHEGAEVSQQSDPRQTGADPEARTGPQERYESGEQTRRSDQGDVLSCVYTGSRLQRARLLRAPG